MGVRSRSCALVTVGLRLPDAHRKPCDTVAPLPPAAGFRAAVRSASPRGNDHDRLRPGDLPRLAGLSAGALARESLYPQAAAGRCSRAHADQLGHRIAAPSRGPQAAAERGTDALAPRLPCCRCSLHLRCGEMSGARAALTPWPGSRTPKTGRTADAGPRLRRRSCRPTVSPLDEWLAAIDCHTIGRSCATAVRRG